MERLREKAQRTALEVVRTLAKIPLTPFGIRRRILSALLKTNQAVKFDKTIDWSKKFNELPSVSHPIKREEVLPNGTEGISDDEIFAEVHNAAPIDSDQPYISLMDAVEFPELIDKDIRSIGSKLNKLDFARTCSNCSGHPYHEAGYWISHIAIDVNFDDPQSLLFLGRIQDLCQSFTASNSNAHAFFTHENPRSMTVNMELKIYPPSDWKEADLPESTLTPSEYLDELRKHNPDFYVELEDGGVTIKKLDPDYQRYLDYTESYRRRKNSYSHSDQCKAIRDRFWEEVGKIAGEMVNSPQTQTSLGR